MPLAARASARSVAVTVPKSLPSSAFTGERQRQVRDRLGQSLGIGQNLGVLVSALAEVLGEDLLGGSRSGLGVTLRDQVVVGVTGLHVHDVVGVAQVLDIFDQNYFHGLVLSFNYFMQSVTKGRMAR